MNDQEPVVVLTSAEEDDGQVVVSASQLRKLIQFYEKKIRCKDEEIAALGDVIRKLSWEHRRQWPQPFRLKDTPDQCVPHLQKAAAFSPALMRYFEI